MLISVGTTSDHSGTVNSVWKRARTRLMISILRIGWWSRCVSLHMYLCSTRCFYALLLSRRRVCCCYTLVCGRYNSRAAKFMRLSAATTTTGFRHFAERRHDAAQSHTTRHSDRVTQHICTYFMYNHHTLDTRRRTTTTIGANNCSILCTLCILYMLTCGVPTKNSSADGEISKGTARTTTCR